MTAVDDVELDGRKGTSNTFFLLLLRNYPSNLGHGAFLDPFGSVQCIWECAISTFIDWLGAVYSFRFRVRFLSQHLGRLSKYLASEEQNGEDVMRNGTLRV